MTRYFLLTGQSITQSITLGNKISGGGEGDIFEIEGKPQYCAKIYHSNRRDPIRDEKIKYMVNHPPEIPDEYKDGIQLAWPTDIIYEQNRVFAGFVMRHFPKQNYMDVENYFHHDSRSSSGREFSWKNSLEIASHIAFVVAFLHNAGYRVGDLKGSNLWVSKKDCSVVFLDCDSFQFIDTTTNITYYCTVGTPEYTPPELFGKDLGYSDRYYSDLFALGTLVFQILMEGAKPYTARGSGVDDAPSYPDKIKNGLFPYGNYYRNVSPPKESLPWRMLSSELQDLCVRCFVSGSKNPQSRPQAIEWAQILYSGSKQLQPCNNNRNHVYLNHVNSCPWCDELRSNHIDYYPGNPPKHQQPKVVPSPPVQKQIHNTATTIPPLPPPPQHHNVAIPTSITPKNRRLNGLTLGLTIAALIILIFFIAPFFSHYLPSEKILSSSSGDVSPSSSESSSNPTDYDYRMIKKQSKTWSYEDPYTPRALAIDDLNHLYVSTDFDTIDKYNLDGFFLSSNDPQKIMITRNLTNPGYNPITGIDIDKNGNIYVVDTINAIVQKFSSDGNLILQWGGKGQSNGQFSRPVDIAVDDKQNVYVTDADNKNVQEFSQYGNFIRVFGREGSEESRLNEPSFIAIDSLGNVYVVDLYVEKNQNHIKKYTSDGTFLKSWGRDGELKDELYLPRAIALDSDNNVYITQTGGYRRIKKYSSEGIFLERWGMSCPRGQESSCPDGTFNNPYDLALDSKNNIYISDTSPQRLYKIEANAPLEQFRE